MTGCKTRAAAKINLALEVLGRRPDGYHDLRMIMQSVTLYDEITLSLSAGGGSFTASSNALHLPSGQKNLALRAARLFLERTGREGWGCEIYIDKKIPVSAGLGGGSSDAAAVLRALNMYCKDDIPSGTLAEWGLELGSDVPFCLQGGLSLAEGRGERLTALPPLPACRFVLCTPPIIISTAAAYELTDRHPVKYRPDWPGLETAMARQDLTAFARRLYNVFEETVGQKHRAVSEIRRIYMDNGALGAVMSGTGPTVIGVFSEEGAARAAWKELAAMYENTFMCEASASSF